MSCMKCDRCERLVNTDEDPDSLYYKGHECLCKYCVKDNDKSTLD